MVSEIGSVKGQESCEVQLPEETNGSCGLVREKISRCGQGELMECRWLIAVNYGERDGDSENGIIGSFLRDIGYFGRGSSFCALPIL